MKIKPNLYSCNQALEQMAKVDGKPFCDRCQKCLTDFRDYSLENIHKTHLQSPESICGIYRPDQLNKVTPLHQKPVKKKGRWWSVAASLAAAFASMGATFPAATNSEPIQVPASVEDSNKEPCCTIRGKVIDVESREPLMFASGIVPGTSIGTLTDIEGNFEIELFDWQLRSEGYWELEFRYVGYAIKTIRIPAAEFDQELIVEMQVETPVIELERMTPVSREYLLGVYAPVKVEAPKRKGFFRRIFGKKG